MTFLVIKVKKKLNQKTEETVHSLLYIQTYTLPPNNCQQNLTGGVISQAVLPLPLSLSSCHIWQPSGNNLPEIKGSFKILRIQNITDTKKRLEDTTDRTL